MLTRIYGHPVAVQLHVDPDLLGGLSITVGDEVIDGSIASRLAAAAEPAAGLTDTKPDRTTEDHPLTQGRKTKNHGRVDNLRF